MSTPINPHTAPHDPVYYASLPSIPHRAAYLLRRGVVAVLRIDPDKMEPGWVADVTGVGQLPCGYHPTADAAVQVGTDWLKGVAGDVMLFDVSPNVDEVKP